MGRNINKSFEDYVKTEKGQPLGFLVVEPEKRKEEKEGKKRKRRVLSWKRKSQKGGFLNCYDFAYAGRDTGNQAAKVAPGIIKGATKDINNIVNRELTR